MRPAWRCRGRSFGWPRRWTLSPEPALDSARGLGRRWRRRSTGASSKPTPRRASAGSCGTCGWSRTSRRSIAASPTSTRRSSDGAPEGPRWGRLVLLERIGAGHVVRGVSRLRHRPAPPRRAQAAARRRPGHRGPPTIASCRKRGGSRACATRTSCRSSARSSTTIASGSGWSWSKGSRSIRSCRARGTFGAREAAGHRPGHLLRARRRPRRRPAAPRRQGAERHARERAAASS